MSTKKHRTQSIEENVVSKETYLSINYERVKRILMAKLMAKRGNGKVSSTLAVLQVHKRRFAYYQA